MEPRTQKGMKTRQKLLDAAEIVFGEKGFYQAGIVDITHQAEVSMGTFYTYFESKEDIFRELVMSMQKGMRRAIKMGTNEITDRIELERAGFRIFFHFLQEHKYLYRIFRQAEFVDEELHRSYFETFSKGYISGLSKFHGKRRNKVIQSRASCIQPHGDNGLCRNEMGAVGTAGNYG
ncbi:TetR/AcrR family transcriptional regulator [Peribacillus frigoritolerans]|nr:TetR/AcrR family transcriptional regulator [Peribacillus frigoritolerans]